MGRLLCWLGLHDKDVYFDILSYNPRRVVCNRRGCDYGWRYK